MRESEREREREREAGVIHAHNAVWLYNALVQHVVVHKISNDNENDNDKEEQHRAQEEEEEEEEERERGERGEQCECVQ